MDPKRKKIYIIIIIVCILGSAGVTFWGGVGGPPAVPDDLAAGPDVLMGLGSDATLDSAGGSAQTGFSAPAVFPATNKFNTKVLESLEFKLLTPYSELNPAGQLGRDNPFGSY